MESTRVLESKLENKDLFLDIIRQVQLPAVQVTVRTQEQEEILEGKRYQELTLLQHLPNYKRIYSNATDQTRTMAAFIYYVLHDQMTGIQKSQTGCSEEFKCRTTPFKHLVTGKKQPGGPGKSHEAGKSSRSLEDFAEIEGATPVKQAKKEDPKKGCGRGHRHG